MDKQQADQLCQSLGRTDLADLINSLEKRGKIEEARFVNPNFVSEYTVLAQLLKEAYT